MHTLSHADCVARGLEPIPDLQARKERYNARLCHHLSHGASHDEAIELACREVWDEPGATPRSGSGWNWSRKPIPESAEGVVRYGVTWDGKANSWRVRFWYRRQNHEIGCFPPDQLDAARRAADRGRIKVMGLDEAEQSGKLNFPPGSQGA